MKAPITLIAAAALGLAGGGAGCTRTDESPEVATIEAEFPSRPTFRHLSSVNGDLPVPGESHQQTASLVADLDGDGDLDILNKPYNWKVPRVDVWLNEGPGE